MTTSFTSPVRKRDIRFDALRGLLLVVMTGVHLPTPVSHAVQEPVGFFSSAEGFVFLAACMAGMVYGRCFDRDGWQALLRKTWLRSGKVYSAHLALLVPIALIAWCCAGWVPELANHFHDFLLSPRASLALTPLLLNQPPLFDILPLYVVLLAVTPFILKAAREIGWSQVVAFSALVWLLAQEGYGLNAIINSIAAAPVHLGAFELLAWQLLWVGGLALGDMLSRGELSLTWKTHRPLIAASALVAAAALFVRHGLWPERYFSTDIYLWMDKWTLGPLRLLSLGSVVVLCLALNPSPPAALLKPLAAIGKNSLVIFCFHIPLVIAATILIESTRLGPILKTVVGLGAIGIIFLFAYALERRNAALKAAAAKSLKTPALLPFQPIVTLRPPNPAFDMDRQRLDRKSAA